MKHLKVLTVLTIIISAITFTACSGGSSPSDVVKKYHNLVKAKDYKAATALFVKKGGEKMSEDEEKKVEGILEMAAKDLEKKDGLKSITIDEETISEDGTTAKVKFTMEYGNGKIKKDDGKLMKIDGNWMLIFG